MALTQEKHLFNPKFQWAWLAPKYWGAWLGIMLLFILAYIPPIIRDPMARSLTSLVLKVSKKQRRIVEINLTQCFPQMSSDERSALMRKTIEIFLQTVFAQGELLLRSPQYIMNRVEVDGWQHVEKIIKDGDKAIFICPHLWGLEFAPTYFMCKKVQMVAIINEHKNPLFNWLTAMQRNRFDSKIYVRQAGIKVLMKGSKAGLHMFYLPDEDYGPDKSEFAPFFGTTKATLPVVNRIARCSGAKAMSVGIAYDPPSRKYKLTIEAPLDCSQDQSKEEEALFLNQQVERIILRDLSQYIWILRVLKTRPPGESPLY
ncbi:MAG: lauroyl-Kdo(2)-lipid IV(A) myristoyltransferase [Gammaproteobacteria bacterium]|nr:lauroyl-Kdo(2)-lipid IV(A) myristoyltransferase [Gammaproteobacteria bacterium]